MFVASIFVISLKGLDNVTKHTSFERNFNLVSVDVVPVENNSLLTMLSVERLFHMLYFQASKSGTVYFIVYQGEATNMMHSNCVTD